MTLKADPSSAPRLRIRIRIQFSSTEMMGPGKAELLERIARTGSIAAAGREMGMSYKRAWMLIETLNAMFRAPVVDSTRGGPGGGRRGSDRDGAAGSGAVSRVRGAGRGSGRRNDFRDGGPAEGYSRRKITIDF